MAMDKFRVYALDKLLTHGGLRPDQCECDGGFEEEVVRID